jgi:hypothetical protein
MAKGGVHSLGRVVIDYGPLGIGVGGDEKGLPIIEIRLELGRAYELDLETARQFHQLLGMH